MDFKYTSPDGEMKKDKLILFLYTPDNILEMKDKKGVMYAQALNTFKQETGQSFTLDFHDWDDFTEDKIRERVGGL